MPTPFGRYTLARKIAEGGMAEVFLARQGGLEDFEKLCVVKRILPALSTEENFIKMFLNEARVAARLNHPNVVQIWDLGRVDDLYYIAMEYVHGEDLRELIRVADEQRTKPPLGLVARIIADTLAGLHYAHTRAAPDGKPLGLVHRDVSPQNILVTYEGSVKLVDFGIAKATKETNEQTQAGLFKGKFAYMSPEQSMGRPLDARSDIFAVGILLWELATWHRLFKRDTDMATLIAVAEDPIPSARKYDASIPPELDRIIQKSLARPLTERYQTAHDMRADLEALIRRERWEGDSLALEGFMRQVFAQKLRMQDEDIRNAGLASLDDFLLKADESTRISWMEERASSSEKRTPSVGLPAAPPKVSPPSGTARVSPWQGMPSSDETVPLPTHEAAAASPNGSPNLFAMSSERGQFPSTPTPTPMQNQSTVITGGFPATPAPATPPPPARSQATTLPPGSAFRASESSTVLMGDTFAPPVLGNEPSTAKRTAFDPPEPKSRRILVIAGVAVLVLIIGLVIVLWPSK